MTQQFKIELQTLIDDAAEKFEDKNHDSFDGYYDSYSFKAGCDFLFPLVEELVKLKEFYIRQYHAAYYGIESEEKYVIEHIEDSHKNTLNLLRGEK